MVVDHRPLGPQGQGSVSQRDLNTEGAEAAADTIGKEGGYVWAGSRRNLKNRSMQARFRIVMLQRGQSPSSCDVGK